MNKRVIEIIERKKLTPSRFADKIGVPRSTISHIISGRNKPSLELVTKIADAFPDISLDWLIKGKSAPQQSQATLFDDSLEFEPQKNLTENAAKSRSTEDNLHMETGKSRISESTTNKKSSKDENYNEQIETEVQKKPGNVSSIIITYDDNTFDVLNPRK